MSDKYIDDSGNYDDDQRFQLNKHQFRVSVSAASSTAASRTDTITTQDEDAQPCEEWELFSNETTSSRVPPICQEENRPESTTASLCSGKDLEARTWSACSTNSLFSELGDGLLEDPMVTTRLEDAAVSTTERRRTQDKMQRTQRREELKTFVDESSTTQTATSLNMEKEDGIEEEDNVEKEESGYDQEEDVDSAPFSSRTECSDLENTDEINETTLPPSILPATISRRIQVFVRVRPLSRAESKVDTVVSLDTHTVRVSVPATNTSASVGSTNSSNPPTSVAVTECAVDRVFSDTMTQEDVYHAVQPSVLAVAAGYNATIFAYGQTGTGKTHTIFGSEEGTDGSNLSKGAGIIPRALTDILNHVETLRANPAEYISRVDMHCSFLQIYNDRVFDLLTDRRRQKPLVIREQPNLIDNTTTVILQGLSSEPVHSLVEALQLVRRGRVNRSVRETELNACSSRSHAIVQVNLIIERLVEGKRVIRKARLNLVDLAGSEKWNTDTDMEDRHSLELKNINTSLSALGNCIAALAEANRKHIPYRDSTLTRVLQDSLGGNTQSCLIATISSSMKASDETLRTLQFADRARSVLQVVRVNESFTGQGNMELIQAKAQIVKLRERIETEHKRRQEQRLKELDRLQREWSDKVQRQEEEIEKLTRDNEVFTRWREEDRKKIRALEERLKSIDIKTNCREERGDEKGDENARDHQHPQQNIRPQREQQKQRPQPVELAKSNVRTVMKRTASRNMENVSYSGIGKSVEKPQGQQPRLKGSYRSLIERYSLGNTPNAKQEKAATVSHREPVISMEKTYGNNHHDDSISQLQPQAQVYTSQVQVQAGSQYQYQSQIEKGEPTPQRPSLLRSHSSTGTVNAVMTGHDTTSDNYGDSPTRSQSLSQLPTLSAIHYRQQQQQVEQQAHALPTKYTSTSAWSQYGNDSTSRSSPQSQQEQQIYGQTSSSKEQNRHVWNSQVPYRQNTIDPMYQQTSSFKAPPQSQTASLNPVADMGCTKHSLKGCVLCAVKDIGGGLPPSLTISNNKGLEPAISSALCERHQLPSCFICVPSGTSHISTYPVTNHSTNPSMTGSSFSRQPPQLMSLPSGVVNSYSHSNDAASPNPCAAHSLPNCLRCIGNKSSTSTSSHSTMYKQMFESPTKRAGNAIVDGNLPSFGWNESSLPYSSYNSPVVSQNSSNQAYPSHQGHSQYFSISQQPYIPYSNENGPSAGGYRLNELGSHNLLSSQGPQSHHYEIPYNQSRPSIKEISPGISQRHFTNNSFLHDARY